MTEQPQLHDSSMNLVSMGSTEDVSTTGGDLLRRDIDNLVTRLSMSDLAVDAIAAVFLGTAGTALTLVAEHAAKAAVEQGETAKIMPGVVGAIVVASCFLGGAYITEERVCRGLRDLCVRLRQRLRHNDP